MCNSGVQVVVDCVFVTKSHDSSGNNCAYSALFFGYHKCPLLELTDNYVGLISSCR